MTLKLLGMAVVAAFAASSLMAQTDRGAIKGTVLDPSAAGVPNAEVHARNQGASIVTKDTTRAQGGFTFSTLQPGVYEVTAEMAGLSLGSFGAGRLQGVATIGLDLAECCHSFSNKRSQIGALVHVLYLHDYDCRSGNWVVYTGRPWLSCLD